MEYTQKVEEGRTFAEVAWDWWRVHEPTLASQSVRGYYNPLEKAVDEFGNTPISKISAKDITAYLRRFAQKSYSEKSIQKHRLVLNSVFKHAMLQGDLDNNPVPISRMPRDLKKSERTAASEKDEEIIKSSWDVWIFPFIAIYTGMRKGEILALTWEDIDFEKNVISVTKSVYHDGDRPFIKTTKTEAGTRLVPLLEPLKEKLLSIENREDRQYIVSDTGERPLTNSRFEKLSARFHEETGTTATAHQLRHSFATIAFELGVPVKSVQEILGHKQISTTMDLYTDFRKKALSDAANILNAGMAKK
jgi:integrase